MKAKKTMIDSIPAVIWGEPSDRVYIHVHGKMSRKEYAEPFAAVADKKGYQTVSFDLPEHGERAENHTCRCDIWNGMHDLSVVADYVFSEWKQVSLFACSVGAYFSLNAYHDKPFVKCLFQSPIADMEYLVRQMLLWNGVTEERLRAEKEIFTPFERLRWDYYQYILQHPVAKWDVPTSILYGGKDNLQTYDVIRNFADKYHCCLTVSENSEHPFMAKEDVPIVSRWLEENV